MERQRARGRHRYIPGIFDVTLPENTAHLWRFALDRDPELVRQLFDCLASDERTRAQRFVAERDRTRFTVGRGLLRTILSRYLQQPARDLRFTYGPQGKPSLVDAPEIGFNLAHSGRSGLLAITRGRRIGVDIEEIRPMADAAAIAARFFAPGEAQAIANAPESHQLTTFFAIWTRKEAYMKALGAGLSIPLDSFEVTTAIDLPAALLSCANDPNAPNHWQLQDISQFPTIAATLAIEKSEYVTLINEMEFKDLFII